ncbi:MAG: hypothetical protein ABL898_17355 [Hyphomicrobiaceae bacterium]|nr:hypothetical protein [Hyphomicrobiaceae bacterium]
MAMTLNQNFKTVRLGAALTLLGLSFGIGLGVAFGMFEDTFKNFIANGIKAMPAVHDAASKDKIWRYVQRAHFHAAGVGGFSLGLIFLVTMSSLRPKMKSLSAALIGMGSLYPLAWLNMFFMAPSIGREPAHANLVTEIFTFVGVGGLLLGMAILFANLFLDVWADESASTSRSGFQPAE